MALVVTHHQPIVFEFGLLLDVGPCTSDGDALHPPGHIGFQAPAATGGDMIITKTFKIKGLFSVEVNDLSGLAAH